MGDFGQVPARPIVLYLGAQPNCDDMLTGDAADGFWYVWFADCERYCCLENRKVPVTSCKTCYPTGAGSWLPIVAAGL